MSQYLYFCTRKTSKMISAMGLTKKNTQSPRLLQQTGLLCGKVSQYLYFCTSKAIQYLQYLRSRRKLRYSSPRHLSEACLIFTTETSNFCFLLHRFLLLYLRSMLLYSSPDHLSEVWLLSLTCIRQHTSASVGICRHTPAYVSTCLHTSASVSIR